MIGTVWINQNRKGKADESGVSKFEEDLAIGELSEQYLMDLVRRKGLTPVKVEGLFKQYDFFVCETKKAYEVKRDWKSAHTGNVVIEIEHPIGTDSGLKTTTADYWIFDLPKEFIFITPDRLKDMLSYERLTLTEFIGNGDTQKKKAYLVDIDLVKKYAQTIFKK